MEKILFCNLDLLRTSFDTYFDPDLHANRDDFLVYAERLCLNEKNQVCFISAKANDLSAAQRVIQNPEFEYLSRKDATEFIKVNRAHNNYYVFISGKDIDFYTAANTKSLFIVPNWIPMESKAQHYGVHVDSPSQLFQFVRTLNNHETWYARATIDPGIIVLSLMDGRYKYHSKTLNERDLIEHFENLLKYGSSRNYYEILLYHFLAGMTNSKLFDDIELFGMIPSSDCSLNTDIFTFMKQVRFIKKKRIPNVIPNGENLLLRKKAKPKAHESHTPIERIEIGPTEEFDTLCINPDFKDKINKLRQNGKLNVCIFDDYLTHGNSFNAVRLLLKHLGANKVVFVSLGNFGQPFQKQEYSIEGDVYDIGYKYKYVESSIISFHYNDKAKDEIDKLYKIFNT